MIERNPKYVERAQKAAKARWAGHDARIVRLDALTPEQARLVRALVAAAKADPTPEAA